MNIGSLYLVKNYCWLLFPTKETAARQIVLAGARAVDTVEAAVRAADYWSHEHNCEVTWFEQGSIIVYLEDDIGFKRVLTTNGRIGWTLFDTRYDMNCFEEVKTI